MSDIDKENIPIYVLGAVLIILLFGLFWFEGFDKGKSTVHMDVCKKFGLIRNSTYSFPNIWCYNTTSKEFVRPFDKLSDNVRKAEKEKI